MVKSPTKENVVADEVEVEDDGDSSEKKMPCLVADLRRQFAQPAKLEAAITANLKGLGYGG